MVRAGRVAVIEGRLLRSGLGLGFAQMIWSFYVGTYLQPITRSSSTHKVYQVCKGRIDVATKELDAAFTQVNELTSGVGGTVGEENADDVPF